MEPLSPKILPPSAPEPWRRDLLTVGVLVSMATILLAAWDAGADRYLSDVAGQMTSYMLLPAMAFLLAMRRGVLDLSVWASLGVGSVAAAAVLERLCPAQAAEPAATGALLAAAGAAMAAGAAIGALNALLVRRSKIPAALVTLAVALAVVLAMHTAPQQIAVGDMTFDALHLRQTLPIEKSAASTAGVSTQALPLMITRMLLVTAVYGAALLALMLAQGRPGERSDKPGAGLTAVILVAGGAMSALGGALRLLEAPAAVAPQSPIGDLRLPAAALLAGGWLLSGRGRTLLAGICLPPALLVATIWQQQVWDLRLGGYDLQNLLLVAATLAVQGAGVWAMERRAKRRWPLAVAGLAVLGLLLLSSAALGESHLEHAGLRYAGLAMLALSMAVVLADHFGTLARR